MTVVGGPRLIVALDFADADTAVAQARRLSPALCRVKVGKELFTASGPLVVERLHALGFEVFLDLKFHDIPNTVAGACRAAAALGVWMVNVHASGGRRMLLAAREALDAAPRRPLLTAVTVLTSMERDDLLEIGVNVAPEEQVSRLAALAAGCGLDGVVCSAQEAPRLRRECGAAFGLVTPGIRPAGAAADDQRRIVTPAAAMAAGATWLVMGRPITGAAEPLEVLQAVAAEMSSANSGSKLSAQPTRGTT
jgi:orotidine-5'-phosphate decarboxylase